MDNKYSSTKSIFTIFQTNIFFAPYSYFPKTIFYFLLLDVEFIAKIKYHRQKLSLFFSYKNRKVNIEIGKKRHNREKAAQCFLLLVLRKLCRKT